MNGIKKTVGIMGGMGPMATADLIYNIVSSTKAASDSDHIHLIIDSDGSVPDRTEAILHGGESPLPKLITMAKKLEYMGADIIAVSCNTSHYFYNEICDAVDVPVLNMLNETARSIARSGAKEVLLLATDATVKMGLYEKYLSQYGIKTKYMSDEGQREVMKLIYDCVKAGHFEFDVDNFRKMLREAGAEDIPTILGCTELPIAFRRFELSGFHTIDPSNILAKAIIRDAGGELK
ncbi:MAG: aspartate/glutamate racemase family protein [Clostridia bacterium]|nr:aspartate/glutamate racemase family protein [Clostridia bacterium]